jgi:glycosyltransferase involved in cell wall biosynthesis
LIQYTGATTTKNICVIPNGIDETMPKVSKKDIKDVFRKYEIPPAQNYMIFLGDIANPRKGAFATVQAFRQVRLTLPDTHLIMVGPWSSRLKTSVSMAKTIQVLNKLAKAGRVTITDWVDELDKVALLNGADLLISPTVYDSFGLALAEALWCKIPVVATKVGGIPFVVRDGIDGILVREADNIEGFARASIKLLQNKNLAKKMGQRGHQRVKKLFLLKTMVQKTQNLYQALIKKYANKKHSRS